MTDNVTDVASTTEAQPAALKSTDTGTLKQFSDAPDKQPSADKPKESALKGNAPAIAATQQEPDGDAGEATHDAPDADASGKGKEQRLPRWMKERLARERQVTEARTREAMLREFQERQPPVTNVASTEHETQGKTLEDFDFDMPKYTAYLVKQGIEQDRAQQQQRESQREQAKAAEQFKAKVDAFEERAGAGVWEDITSSPLNTDPAFKPLVDLFMGDDHDLDIAHYLATNLTEAQRIAALTPLQRVKEVAKLASQFDGAQESKPAPVIPKKITNAPPPPKTVAGSGKSSVSEDDPDISPDQRIALWQAKRKRHR